MNDLKVYLNSLEEGDNITVTADLLNAMEEACKELDILDIIKKGIHIDYDLAFQSEFVGFKSFSDETIRKVKEWLGL